MQLLDEEVEPYHPSVKDKDPELLHKNLQQLLKHLFQKMKGSVKEARLGHKLHLFFRL